MKIACISYRDWALKIYENIMKDLSHEYLLIKNKDEYDEEVIKKFNPDLILYYGWSWIIKDNIINNYKCIMLHPAPLPKYRGGSPIQNQIIRGEKKSAVTLFVMKDGVDNGEIILQKEISFEGHLNEIFDRITNVGTELTQKMIRGEYKLQPQDENEATTYKRRKESDSEITLEELQTKPAEYLYDKIRMLEDPYPNAYIKTVDGKKLLIKFAEIGE